MKDNVIDIFRRKKDTTRNYKTNLYSIKEKLERIAILLDTLKGNNYHGKTITINTTSSSNNEIK